jgi:hypothetical protein|tara:strand:+ start:447 stop:650 length:204 start_codon:yes stop_codon:yes gene_type:complete
MKATQLAGAEMEYAAVQNQMFRAQRIVLLLLVVHLRNQMDLQVPRTAITRLALMDVIMMLMDVLRAV